MIRTWELRGRSTMAFACLLSIGGLALAAPPATPTTDWPQFLGPRGSARAAPTSDIPLRWNDRLNILWRTRLPGRGWSSPVVAGDSIWLTSSENSDRSLRLLQLDRLSGDLRANHLVLEVRDPGKIHPKNTHATPTPVVASGAVYVHFGTHGTARVGLDGQIAWTTRLPYYHHHGPAASPVVVGDLLIVSCDGFTRPFYARLRRSGVTSAQFVVALDLRTGQPRWRKPRVQGRHSYSTPLVLDAPDRPQVISAGGDRVVSYDPASGDELWWIRYTGYSVVPCPVAGPPGSGLIYVCTGFDDPRLLAIRTDGSGDVTATHVAWQHVKAIPRNPTPLLVDDALYLVNDAGIASCLDARSGALRWRRRLGGQFSASPLLVSGHVLALNETGTAHVLIPGSRYRRLALNRLKGRTLATPAVTGDRLLIRTDRELVCVGRE